MADVDPYAQLQQLTPRPSNLVNAIDETRRALDASIRSNPLLNATVDSGLMVWRGNYAGLGGISDSFLWIGEVSPNDVFLNKQQRGVFITRDDPRHAAAFWVYDPDPQPSGLRQMVHISDSDGATILDEARGGGTRFPFGQVNLYPASVVLISGVPIMSPAFPIDAADRLVWQGYGPMVGHKLKIWAQALSFPAGVGAMTVYCQIEWQDDTSGVFSTSSVTVPDNSNISCFWDLDFIGQNKVGREVHVSIFARRSGSTGTWNYGYIMPLVCYSYGAGIYG